MEDYTKDQKINFFTQRKVDKNRIWLTYLFLGWSYGSMGQMGKQILFYLTAGGLGVWALIQLFTLNGNIKKYNRKIATQLGLTTQDLVMLGLS